MEKNTMESKTRKTIDTKYKSLENKISELLNSVTNRKIKTVSDGFHQDLIDFLNSNNIVIIKKEDGNYYMKNGARGKKLIQLSERMSQKLKLLGFYTEQDYAEKDIVSSIVNSMQKFLNDEDKTISKEYEILEINTLSDNPNEISVTLIDSSGDKIENIVLPISLTKYINQSPEYVHKIEMEILFSLQKRLDEVLNKLLKDIEDEYKGDGEAISFRKMFVDGDFSQNEIIEDVLNNLKIKHKEFEQAIKDYKLLREDDGIYLKCQNESIKLPDSIVTKLKLLGFFDDKEETLIEEVIKNILDVLTISEFHHENEYITPEGYDISGFSTLGDLTPDEENAEKISNLNGLAVYVTKIEEDKMFKNKKEEERKETTFLLPYEFMKIVTQSSKDAFGTEMEILRTINELFLQNTQISEVNSKEINRTLEKRGIILNKKLIDGKIQFVAKKGNQEILIDKKISQNILEYMKSEITSIAISQYVNNEEIHQEEPQSEEDASEDIQEKEYEEYLLKTYKFLEKLNERGYIARGISTGIVEQNMIYSRNPTPNKIVLGLPYGIKEDLTEINETFNKIMDAGQYVDPRELLLMIKCIKRNIGQVSNFEEYKRMLSTSKTIDKGVKSIFEGLNKIKRMFNKSKREPERYTMSGQQEPPTRALEHLIPELKEAQNKTQAHTDGIAEILDENNNVIGTASVKEKI